jgi:hypothetical protein
MHLAVPQLPGNRCRRRRDHWPARSSRTLRKSGALGSRILVRRRRILPRRILPVSRTRRELTRIDMSLVAHYVARNLDRANHNQQNWPRTLKPIRRRIRYQKQQSKRNQNRRTHQAASAAPAATACRIRLVISHRNLSLYRSPRWRLMNSHRPIVIRIIGQKCEIQ